MQLADFRAFLKLPDETLKNLHFLRAVKIAETARLWRRQGQPAPDLLVF